ncbi:MAG: hypothetical protein AB7F43_11545 [Bacteriovoracia bacterium]
MLFQGCSSFLGNSQIQADASFYIGADGQPGASISIGYQTGMAKEFKPTALALEQASLAPVYSDSVAAVVSAAEAHYQPYYVRTQADSLSYENSYVFLPDSDLSKHFDNLATQIRAHVGKFNVAKPAIVTIPWVIQLHQLLKGIEELEKTVTPEYVKSIELDLNSAADSSVRVMGGKDGVPLIAIVLFEPGDETDSRLTELYKLRRLRTSEDRTEFYQVIPILRLMSNGSLRATPENAHMEVLTKDGTVYRDISSKTFEFESNLFGAKILSYFDLKEKL